MMFMQLQVFSFTKPLVPAGGPAVPGAGLRSAVEASMAHQSAERSHS